MATVIGVIKPMRNFAWLIRNSFDGIVAWTQTHRAGGLVEALNGLFHVTKRQARGRFCFETMRVLLLRIAAGLDFARINPHAAEPTCLPAARVRPRTGASKRRHSVPP
ncbi:MAG: transposase, partial [uncultured bacterium]